MSYETEVANDVICPLPYCDSPVYLVRSFTIPITDGTKAGYGTENSIVDDWEVACEDGHVVASGGDEVDSRTPLHGWRIAQSMAGVR